MQQFSIGQRVRVVNALVNAWTPPTFATVTGMDENVIYAKLSENGPEYSYRPSQLEPASEEVVTQETEAHQQSAQEAHQTAASRHQAQAVSTVPSEFSVTADWLCQECGHTWNGKNGDECPRCGERSMIVSPRGRG